MRATTIHAVHVTTLDMPLRQPFGIAGGVQAQAHNLLVTVELAGGVRGYGEAAPLPPYNGETQAQAGEALERARPLVIGEDVRSWRALAEHARTACAPSGAAQCAIEVALLDALCRVHGMPLWAHFGGAQRRLTTDMTIGLGSVDEASQAAHAIRAAGFSTIKIKVGSADLDLDVARCAAVAQVAEGAAELMLDANGAYKAPLAIELLVELARREIRPRVFEQPCAHWDLAGLRRVREHTDALVAADESVSNVSDVGRIVAAGAAQVVNVKLMKRGVLTALEVVAAAQAAGLTLMIGGMLESRLAMSAAACFAAGLGGFEYADLDTPLMLAAEPFVGGYAQHGSTLDLEPITVGHGVLPAN